jgi:hypothetical protein
MRMQREVILVKHPVELVIEHVVEHAVEHAEEVETPEKSVMKRQIS